jgi:hypothetical protein
MSAKIRMDKNICACFSSIYNLIAPPASAIYAKIKKVAFSVFQSLADVFEKCSYHREKVRKDNQFVNINPIDSVPEERGGDEGPKELI